MKLVNNLFRGRDVRCHKVTTKEMCEMTGEGLTCFESKS